MRVLIERQYRRDEIYAIYGKNSTFHSMTDFDRLADSEKAKIKVYTGHIYYGLHEKIANDTTYFALMRDPVERVISYYHHVMSHDAHFKDNKLSLLKFYDRKNLQLDNHQTRILSGLKAAYGACTEDMLWTAIDNIESKFSLVGLAERFDESLLLMARLMGWESLGYAIRNASKNKHLAEYYSSTELNMIRNNNRLDMILYAYAKKLFERKRLEAANEIDRMLSILEKDKMSFQQGGKQQA